MRFSQNELNVVFNYLDANKSGKLSYLEFCSLTDERISGKDPFKNDPPGPAEYQRQKNDLAMSTGIYEKQQSKEDIMKIFNNRKALFDMENFKRKTLSNTKTSLLEAKVDLENSVGKKLQDFKFKKLQNNFSQESLAKTFLNEKDDESRIGNLNKY